nr:carboxymuconolactone decarboxylase family protein [Actinomadura verrucosospora]
MKGIGAIFKAVNAGGISHELQEIVGLRASQINGCSACVHAHNANLVRAGESTERIAAVAAWREAPFFDDAERAALALTLAVTRLARNARHDGDVRHALRAAARAGTPGHGHRPPGRRPPRAASHRRRLGTVHHFPARPPHRRGRRAVARAAPDSGRPAGRPGAAGGDGGGARRRRGHRGDRRGAGRPLRPRSTGSGIWWTPWSPA